MSATKRAAASSGLDDDLAATYGIDTPLLFSSPPVKRRANIAGSPLTPTFRTSFGSSLATTTPTKPVLLTPAPFLSPASPQSSSSDFHKRFGARKVVESLEMNTAGEDVILAAEPCLKKRSEIQLVNTELQEPYFYMFQKIDDVAASIDDEIDRIADDLKQKYNILRYSHPGIPNQVPIFTAGRIVCDGEGKLNEKSIMLETSKKIGSGCTVRLDIHGVSDYSVFPGQMVALEGMNITGNMFVASKIYTDSSKPTAISSVVPSVSLNEEKKTLSIFVAAGPYTISDLQYEPFQCICQVINEQKPDVVILLGPFLDMSHPIMKSGKVTSTLSDIFRTKILQPLLDAIENGGTQCILIPSIQDASAPLVFPQPPFQLFGMELPSNFLLLPNPSILYINDILIGITSMDTILTLAGEEIASKAPKDRIGRLMYHMIEQQSFYPSLPAKAGIPLDIPQMHLAELNYVPDILISPSDLKAFVKTLPNEKTVGINPGKFCKGKTGSYCTMEVACQRSKDSNNTVRGKFHIVSIPSNPGGSSSSTVTSTANTPSRLPGQP